MAHPYYPSGNPRLNHVAMSLDPGLLDATHRADLCDFWGQVFGFEELEVMTQDRHRLVLSCVHWDQFLFLIADDDPMRCPRLDHFGFAVGSLDELQGVRDRAVAYREHDDRVDLVDLAVDDQGVVRIHSVYVRFLLPMMAEVQWWEFPR
jgi:hypothetical protein